MTDDVSDQASNQQGRKGEVTDREGEADEGTTVTKAESHYDPEGIG